MIFTLFVSVLCAQNAQYTEKSGKIVYTYEVGGEPLDFVMMYDDFGKKQVMDIVTIVDGTKERVKTIITAENMYLVNFTDKQVLKFPISVDKNNPMVAGQNQGIDVDEIVASVTDGRGSILGEEVVSGKKCKVYEHREGSVKGKFWIYNGFLLKAEFIDQSGVHTYMVAKEFNLGVTIPASEFEIPAGFTVTDMNDMMQQMQQLQQLYGVPDQE